MGPIRSAWIYLIGLVDWEVWEEEGLKAQHLALPAVQPSQVFKGGGEVSNLMPRRGGLLDLTALSASQLRWPTQSYHILTGRVWTKFRKCELSGFSACMMHM